MSLSGQNIAVLGAGTSGFAAAELAVARKAASVCVYDSGDPAKLEKRRAEFAAIGVDSVFGEAALVPPSNLNLTIISPGIDAGWPIGKAFSATGAPLIGEIEFAWRSSGGTPVIAITGTNGKTTTTEMTAAILNACGVKTVAAGNVGTAYCEVILSGEAYDVIVVEVSSFQLETISTFRPEVALWMNFAPDHMDRYTALEDYRNAKLRIFENQTSENLAVIQAGTVAETEARKQTFSGFSDDADFTLKDGDICFEGEAILDFGSTRLNGKHNAENVMAAMAAARSRGVSFGSMADSIQQFQAPPHRCEVIAKINDVTYVNDSKATNLHALESSLRGQEAPVVLIVGGKDKGLNYDELTGIVGPATSRIICIGEMAERILSNWNESANCETADSLDAAVEAAARSAKPGQTVLFSPGTSSFDMFSSYNERGDAFRSAVNNLN